MKKIESRLSKREKITKKIKEHILSGYLKPGVALPGIRALAKYFDVAENTIVAALGELRKNGWLESVPKRGIFVANNINHLILDFSRDNLQRTSEYIASRHNPQNGPAPLVCAVHDQRLVKLLELAAPAFEKKFRTLRLEVRHIPELYNKRGSEVLADIEVLPNSAVARSVRNGSIAPIEQFLPRQEILNLDLFPGLLTQVTYQDQYCALPLTVGALLVLVDRANTSGKSIQLIENLDSVQSLLRVLLKLETAGGKTDKKLFNFNYLLGLFVSHAGGPKTLADISNFLLKEDTRSLIDFIRDRYNNPRYEIKTRLLDHNLDHFIVMHDASGHFLPRIKKDRSKKLLHLLQPDSAGVFTESLCFCISNSCLHPYEAAEWCKDCLGEAMQFALFDTGYDLPVVRHVGLWEKIYSDIGEENTRCLQEALSRVAPIFDECAFDVLAVHYEVFNYYLHQYLANTCIYDDCVKKIDATIRLQHQSVANATLTMRDRGLIQS